jgi:hypothetical protein
MPGNYLRWAVVAAIHDVERGALELDATLRTMK